MSQKRFGALVAEVREKPRPRFNTEQACNTRLNETATDCIFDNWPDRTGSGSVFPCNRCCNHQSFEAIAQKIAKSPQAVQGWRAGSSLMSDEMLTKVRRILRKHGVSAAHLRALTRAHIRDVLVSMPRLKYLTPAQRTKLGDAGAKVI